MALRIRSYFSKAWIPCFRYLLLNHDEPLLCVLSPSAIHHFKRKKLTDVYKYKKHYHQQASQGHWVRGWYTNNTLMQFAVPDIVHTTLGTPPTPRVHPGPPTRLLFSSSWAFLNSCSKEQSSSLKRPTSSQFFRNLVGVGVWSESRGRRSVTGFSLQCMVDGSKFLHTIPCPTATHTLPALQL